MEFGRDFLYIFEYDLPINVAYRKGKARVGCLICPFSTSWDDMVIQKAYPEDLRPFVDRLKNYASQVKIADFRNFLSERKWKLKPLGDRKTSYPKVIFKSELSTLDFIVEITDAKHSFLKWLPALCPYTTKNMDKGFEGELHFKKNVFPFAIEELGNKSVLVVRGKLPNELIFLLRRLAYKRHIVYIVRCVRLIVQLALFPLCHKLILTKTNASTAISALTRMTVGV